MEVTDHSSDLQLNDNSMRLKDSMNKVIKRDSFKRDSLVSWN